MDNNLVSLNKLQTDIKAMKLISILLKPEQRKQLKDKRFARLRSLDCPTARTGKAVKAAAAEVTPKSWTVS